MVLRMLTYLLASSLSLLVLIFLWFFFLRLTPIDRQGLTQRYTTVAIKDQSRKYRVRNGSSSEKRPLVVVLHGYRDRGKWIEIYSGLSNLADNEGFTAVYPEGKQMSWNGDFCCGHASLRQTEDAEFIEKMIEDIKETYAINNKQIYVVGFSNGGLLAQRLLHQLPGTFASGVSVMSGISDGRSELDISEAEAPIMLVNGSRDPYTQPNMSSSSFSFVSPNETLDAWVMQYDARLLREDDNDNYQQKVFAADGETKVISRIYDEGHRWPQWRLWNFEEKVPRFTRDAWDFLQTHQRD